MKALDDTCLDIQVALDDIQMKSEQKKQFEMQAERLGFEIKALKSKVDSIIKSKLEVKQTKVIDGGIK